MLFALCDSTKTAYIINLPFLIIDIYMRQKKIAQCENPLLGDSEKENGKGDFFQ